MRTVPPAVLLALGLLQVLQHRALWYDEAYSRLAAGVPLTTLLSGIWHRQGITSYLMDVPPSFNGPYYVLLHVWVLAFGSSAASLRLASLLCAVVAVGVLAELLRRLAGTRAALLGGLLLATGPLLVEETTQARDYGPALLALSLCALWLHPLDDRGPAVPRRRALVAGVAAGLLHWFTLPVLAGLAVWSWSRGGAGRRTAVLLLLACLPAALLVAWSLAGGAYGAPHPAAVGVRLPVQALEDWAGGRAVLAAALAAAAAVGIWHSPHRRLLACWSVVPASLITGLELVRPTYFPRYLLFTLVGVVLAAALGVAGLRPVGLRRGLTALLVALSLAATLPTTGAGDEEPSPAAVSYLAGHQVTGQPIVPAEGRVALDLETYLDQAPRLSADIVLPPELFTDQTSSPVVWLVRVVLHRNSLAVVPAEQRLLDAGWTRTSSVQLHGTTTDLRVESWTR